MAKNFGLYLSVNIENNGLTTELKTSGYFIKDKEKFRECVDKFFETLKNHPDFNPQEDLCQSSSNQEDQKTHSE